MSALNIETNDISSILVEHTVPFGAQRVRSQAGGIRSILLPKQMSRLGVESENGLGAFRLGRTELLDQRFGGFSLIYGAVFFLHKQGPPGHLGGSTVGDIPNDQKQSPLVEDNLIGAAGIVVNLEDLSRRGIYGRERCVKTQGDIDAIVNGYQPSLELARRLTPVDDVGKPQADRLLPEQDSIEGIPSDELPLGSLTNGGN